MSDQTPDVAINYAPALPQGKAATFAALILQSEEIARQARRYIDTGDTNCARKLENARMVMRSIGCKSHLNSIDCAIIDSGHPLTAEEVAEVKMILREADGPAGL